MVLKSNPSKMYSKAVETALGNLSKALNESDGAELFIASEFVSNGVECLRCVAWRETNDSSAFAGRGGDTRGVIYPLAWGGKSMKADVIQKIAGLGVTITVAPEFIRGFVIEDRPTKVEKSAPSPETRTDTE